MATIHPRIQRAVLLWALFLFAVPAMAATADEPSDPRKCVLVLHSYHHGFSWSDSISRGISEVFADEPQFAELRFEFMDTRHVTNDAYLDAFADMLQIKYAAQCLDVVICADDHALQFMLDRGESLAPGVPIVFCSVSGFRPDMRDGRRLTGLRESIAMGETLELALRLHPDTREVVVITDESRTGQALRERAEVEFASLTDRVSVRYVDDKTVAELQDIVAEFSERTLVFLLIFGRDSQGRVFSHEQNLERLAPYCSVPVYSVWDFYLGHGIVGGKLADGVLEGAMAARLARRILAGENAADIPLGKSPLRYMFDWRQLDRFGLAEAALPPDSVLEHRSFSFYRTYRALIWSTLAVFMILVGLIVALFVSISRRRRVELEVRRSERRLRAVFEGASKVAFIIADVVGPVYTIQEFSPGAEKIFGYSRDEILGDAVARLHLAEDAVRLADVLRRMQHGRKGLAGELTMVRQDGSHFPAWIATHPLYDEHGRLYAALGVIIDITDRRRAEEAREILEDQLRHSQRIEAVGQLAGGVAHDFNNLLQAILGYGELAEAETEPGSRVSDCIGEVLKASERAKVLVSQLLAFSRQQVLEMNNVDLNESVSEMMMMLRRVIGAHIELEVVPGRDLGTVRADRGQIGQILTNLCINARDAITDGGAITIETANVQLDEEFCANHAEARPGPYVRLSVADDGSGMDDVTISRIFEPFFTTKDVGKGTGLGLATVYGLVRQHGGLIRVASEVGEGSTFEIYLPRIERDSVGVVDDATESVPGGTEVILLAEDDDMVRRLSKTMLEGVGYTVLVAADGVEALAVFAKHAAQVDLAVLDVVMPGLGGDAVFERMREVNPDVRVLFSSGYAMDGIHTDFVLDEGLDLLQKPYRHHDLLLKVREVLDQG